MSKLSISDKLTVIIGLIIILIFATLCSCTHHMRVWVKDKDQITITDSSLVIVGPAVIKPGGK